MYWDCYRDFTTPELRENPEQPDFSFEEIERIYYSDYVDAQNARDEKTQHTERNRTVEDLLKNNKTCPEESIYQIGTMEESVSSGTLSANFMRSLNGALALISTFWIGRCIWMRVHPISMNAMCLTAETGMGSCVPNRKRRWKNWTLNCLIRISPGTNTTTASGPLMQYAGRYSLTSTWGTFGVRAVLW